jgi:outer membrane protein assembly factor BamB
VIVVGRRRLQRAAWIAAGFVTISGTLLWLLLTLTPLRATEVGPFAHSLVTPTDALAATRRAHPEASWPMFGGSPARVRYVTSELRPPFRIARSIRGESLLEMPPAVSQGLLVFGNHDGHVIAARTRDGARLWSTDLRGCIASSPAVRAGIVYIGWSGPAPCGRRQKDGTGGIVALGLHTGKVLWRFSPGNVEASPAVVADRLFFSAFLNRRESRVYAMKLGPNRSIVWSQRLPTKVASSPALLGRRLYVSAYDRRVYSFDGWTGRLRWQTSAFADDAETRVLMGLRSLVKRRSWWEGGYYATPAAAYGRIYLGVIDGVFSAFDAHSGVHRWSRKLAGSIYGSAAVWNDTVYVGTTSGTFYALSAPTGVPRWQHDLGGKILGSPTVTNGRVYVSTTKRETIALDARTGAELWRFWDGYYSPLVVAGSRGFLVGKGRIYVIENAASVASSHGLQAS